MVPAKDALDRLRDGNTRFVDGDRCIDTYLSHTKLDKHLMGQAPYAVVLGCSDSRVPVEIIFDVGLGDLFVIRVAGNIVAPSLIGSVELAAGNFGARLVVVLGHTECGAVQATYDALQEPVEHRSKNINSIIEYVRPSFETLLASGEDYDRETLIKKAIRTNVRSTVNGLMRGSKMLEKLILKDGLLVIGAEYSLETGIVEFFDDGKVGE
ncbi:MAG: carbonic anhydrase [Proteobacteria bacterium]|nr:carbonic anhydrase [Pseudomonadota bacterium]MDA0995010.1 carbonic anhydrase [Pseudomonadota bacterium]